MKDALPVLFLILLLAACDGSTGDTADTTTAPDTVTASDTVSDSDTVTAPDTVADSVTASDAVTVSDTASPPDPTTPFPWSVESWDEACADEIDNDGNGYTDCDDFACSRNLAVTVCGAAARYEASPDACDNEIDDDGDGLTDCDDPDCTKNPFTAVCPVLREEYECDDGEDDDEDGVTDCDDLDCLLAQRCDDPRTRVLFDQSLDENATGGGNADWLVDGLRALPFPSNPTGPDDWDGALSSFAYALWASGDYVVGSLPSPTGALTWEGDDALDLGRQDVLVVFEASRQMTSAEKAAVIHFVDAGGGLLLVANHMDSDRDGNGWSAVAVYNDLFDDNPVRPDPFGLRFDEVDLDTGAPIENVAAPAHPVIAGPHGTVERIGFYWGSSAHLTGSQASAVALLQHDDAADASSDIVAGAVEVGDGRVVFLTDSAIGGDGTDSHGNTNDDKDAWNSTSQDNRAFFLNAVAWLAGRPGTD